MVAYHDHEWGIPCRDDRDLFERLLLEGFQAGLSWRTILHKRENFRAALDGFDPDRIAAYGDDDLARLLSDPGIVRNRLKMRGAVTNARAWLTLRDQTGSPADFIWSFAPDQPVISPRPGSYRAFPTSTPESDAMSKALRARGFTFVGSTICYALMQSIGMVDDHADGCYRTWLDAAPSDDA
ncbi:MAG: DNA-3-methyladenine glycosylase I [Thermomicrobiales bacterium]